MFSRAVCTSESRIPAFSQALPNESFEVTSTPRRRRCSRTAGNAPSTRCTVVFGSTFILQLQDWNEPAEPCGDFSHSTSEVLL